MPHSGNHPLEKILKFSDYPKRLRGGALSEGIPKPGRSKKFKIFSRGLSSRMTGGHASADYHPLV